MTNTEVSNRLRPLMGKKVLYREETYHLETFKIDKDGVVMNTSKGPLRRLLVQMPAFLELLENNIVDFDLPAVQDNNGVHAVQVERIVSQLEQKVQNQNDKVFSVIDEMIELVKNDPSKMPQANATNDLLKTRVDAMKTQVLASKI